MKLTTTILLIVLCIGVITGAYHLIETILCNNGSLLLVAGTILLVAGIFCGIENRVRKVTDNKVKL